MKAKYYVRLWGIDNYALLSEKKQRIIRTGNVTNFARNCFLLDDSVALVEFRREKESEPTVIRRENVNLQVICVETEVTPIDEDLTSYNHRPAK